MTATKYQINNKNKIHSFQTGNLIDFGYLFLLNLFDLC